MITKDISDHYPVFAREKFPTLPEDSILVNYKDFLKQNLSNFKNYLQDINFNPVLINDDADGAYNLFQSILLIIFNQHPPMQTKNIYFPIQTKNIYNCGISKPWITPGILAAIRRKRSLEKKICENPERFLTEYPRYRNLLTKVTRTAREQYYNNLPMSSFGNSKKVWSNISSAHVVKHSW